jgi:type IV secretion system protein TrbL
MATADPAVLDDFLNKFKTQVDAGFGLIQGDVSGVLATLVTISIVITAVLWAIDETQNVLASLVRKVLLVGFFAWLVAQWHTLSTTVVNGFAALGLKAGGGAMSVSTFTTSPSQIVMAGIKVIQGLLQYVQRIAPGPIEFFAHIDVVAMALVAAIGILIAFVILAVEIVVTIIEFHIVTLVAFVTVPFGVLSQTAFMSERAIGYVVSVGIKLMALAIVVSLGTSVFDTYTVSANPGIGEDVGLLLAAGAIPPSGSLPSGGSGPAPSGGSPGPGGGPNTGGGGPGPGDFARAPVSSTVQTLRVAGERLLGGSPASSPAGSEDEASPAPSPAPSPPPSPPKETTAPAQPARSAVGDLARGAATTAAQSDEGGPGMSATPVPRDDTPET